MSSEIPNYIFRLVKQNPRDMKQIARHRQQEAQPYDEVLECRVSTRSL